MAREWLRRWGGWLFAAGMLLLLAKLAIRGEIARETFRYSLQGIALFGIFASLYCWRGNALPLRLLEWRPLRWMGRMSYGAYLWHFIALHVLGLATGIWDPAAIPYAKRGLFALAGIAVTFGLAALSYRLVLRPLGWLRRRFGSHTVD